MSAIAAIQNVATTAVPDKAEDAPEDMDSRIVQIMGKVAKRKRELFQETKATRYKGINGVKERVYVGTDIGTALFGFTDGLSLIAQACPKFASLLTSQGLKGLVLASAIGGIIGGALAIAEGAFVLSDGIQNLQNGQYGQAAYMFAVSVLLIGIGTLIFLSGLSFLGAQIGAVGAIAANPYAMPILLFLLTVPGLIQTIRYLVSVAKSKDTGSLLLDPKLRGKLVSQKLAELKVKSSELKENLCKLMEQLTQELGIVAGIDAFELLRLLIQQTKKRVLQKKIEKFRRKLRGWNRMMALRAVQLTLYALTLPTGIASAKTSQTVGNMIAAASDYFLGAPKAMAAYMDQCKPFSRNSPLAVARVEVADC